MIPAENIVAAFQGSRRTVFAIARTPSEAQIFLEVPFDHSNSNKDGNFPWFNFDISVAFVGIRARSGWSCFESGGCGSCP